ncbi:MAG: hypothetical protein L3K05_06825 [Thermoplasmata archaeon]|nr:hypothetical protein [Thermoplasmata archaeon]
MSDRGPGPRPAVADAFIQEPLDQIHVLADWLPPKVQPPYQTAQPICES